MLLTSLSEKLNIGILFLYFLRHRLFWLTVVLPTALAIIYFGIIASDVYISESRFVVRSPERQTASPLGLIFKGTGFSKAQDDVYAVQEFMLSRDALHVLNQELNLKQAFSNNSVDIISRFSGLDWDDSFEALHLYYQKKVLLQLDSTSSIVALTTKAFSPSEAQAINQRLLELSEELVNRLNERARKDIVRQATTEVAEAENRAKTAALALAHYRNEKGVIDPEKQSSIPLLQIAKLQEQLIGTKSMILQLERVARDNSQLPVLQRQAQLLEQEIAAEGTRVAGAGDKSLASKAAIYQQLALDKEFAEKMLASAMSSLEQAKNDAQRQQLYLERITGPSLPDGAMEPRRLKAILSIFILGLIAWGVLTMIVAGVREHMD